jgi:hypothetical protein
MLTDGMEKPWQTPDGLNGSSEELTLRVQAFPNTDPVPEPHQTNAVLEKSPQAR